MFTGTLTTMKQLIAERKASDPAGTEAKKDKNNGWMEKVF
jgi:hypothetical protein